MIFIVPQILRMISIGRTYDTRVNKKLDSKNLTSFDVWTLKAPTLYLKSVATKLQKRVKVNYDIDLWTVHENLDILQAGGIREISIKHGHAG